MYLVELKIRYFIFWIYIPHNNEKLRGQRVAGVTIADRKKYRKFSCRPHQMICQFVLRY